MVVRSLFTRRAQLVCDSTNSLTDETNYLKVFSKNNYNADFIRRNTYKPAEQNGTNANPTPITTATIPYIKGTSETIARILHSELHSPGRSHQTNYCTFLATPNATSRFCCIVGCKNGVLHVKSFLQHATFVAEQVTTTPALFQSPRGFASPESLFRGIVRLPPVTALNNVCACVNS